MPEGPTSLVVLDAERHHLVAVLTPDEPARDWKVEDVTVTEPGVIKRAIGAAAIGNVTEWYDFGVYAYFEPTIQKVFFSNLSDTMGTIATFAHLRRGVPGPPVRRAVLRPARGPHRPQQGARRPR